MTGHSRHTTLVSRVARKLAAQAFAAKWKLELSLFGAAAEKRRDIWVDRNWPTYSDEAREILADILPDVLLATYCGDESEASARLTAASGEVAVVTSAINLACICQANAIGERLAELFDGPVSSDPVQQIEASAPPCSRS